MGFFMDYGPIIIVWICAAVIVNLTVLKDKMSVKNYFPEGMGYGLLTSNLVALWLHTDFTITTCLGFIIGLTIGMLIKRK